MSRSPMRPAVSALVGILAFAVMPGPVGVVSQAWAQARDQPRAHVQARSAAGVDGGAPRTEDGSEAAAEAEQDATAQSAPRRWETPVREPPRNMISLPLFTLLHRGVGLAYERALPLRFSVTGSAAFARPASGDFTSRRRSFSVAGRYYVLPRGPFTRFRGPAPVGLFLETRVGVTRTALADDDGVRIGVGRRVAVATAVGYRFSIRGVVELTPSVGPVFYAELDRYLPAMIRPTVAYGLTVGGMVRGRSGETAVERRSSARQLAR